LWPYLSLVAVEVAAPVEEAAVVVAAEPQPHSTVTTTEWKMPSKSLPAQPMWIKTAS
jgi:hypothetical protein